MYLLSTILNVDTVCVIVTDVCCVCMAVCNIAFDESCK